MDESRPPGGRRLQDVARPFDGGDPNAMVSQKVEDPRCIVYFGNPEVKEAFFAWLATQDHTLREQQSKNECYVAYLPKREQNKYQDETLPPDGESATN